MGWQDLSHLYQGVTLDEHNRRVLDDLDYFARADAWAEPARVDLLRAPVRAATQCAAGLPPGSPARDTATVTRGTRDPDQEAA